MKRSPSATRSAPASRRERAPKTARRTIAVDAGVLKAAIDRSDVDSAWAIRALTSTAARFVTCEAAITEAQHGLENHPVAIEALSQLLSRMEVIPLAHRIPEILGEARKWAPRMDFADACAVILSRSFELAFVLTTDFRDFSAYRVPFASPEGAFYV